MLRHSSGQARVTLSGKTYYLGKHGTTAAMAKYLELVKRWEAGGRQPLEPRPDVERAKPMRDVFALYLLTHVKREGVQSTQHATR